MAKFSLIFMYDDGKTIRWRMGPSILRTLLITLVLLPIIAGGSLWLNWMLYQERQAMQAEKSALQREVDSNAQTAARLANLEQYLSRNDPDSLNKLVVALAPPAVPSASSSELLLASVSAGTGQPAATGPNAAQAQADDAVESGTGTAVDENALDPATNQAQALNASGDRVGDVPGEAAADAATTAQDKSASDLSGPSDLLDLSDPSDLSEDLPDDIMATDPTSDSVDTGLARVENLTARRIGTRSLRISFDLYNTEQVPQLAGKATFELILKDGRSFPLEAHGDTTYRINRLKKIVGNPTLPTGITNTEGAMIRVSIFANNELIYRTLTPL